jgi:hypothetical protein
MMFLEKEGGILSVFSYFPVRMAHFFRIGNLRSKFPNRKKPGFSGLRSIAPAPALRAGAASHPYNPIARGFQPCVADLPVANPPRKRTRAVSARVRG